MAESYARLVILGAKPMVRRFADDEHWKTILGVRYLDWLDSSPSRHECEFYTHKAVTQAIAVVARFWPKLTFLCDFEIKRKRIKVLVVAKDKRLENCAINY